MNIRKIIEAEATKALKSKLIGKKVSLDTTRRYNSRWAKISENGKYEIVDVTVSIEENSYYDSGDDYDYTEFDYNDTIIAVVAETLKARKKRTFEIDLDEIL